ncbi:MAG: 3-hydroxyacyl-ACP dehydratase FabZ [Syntrophobacteraceae bacterium]
MSEDIEYILKSLPHRYPFLLLDRVLEITADEIVGLKNVTINEPFFQGHFPRLPVMPGVLIIEAMAQTGGVLALSLLPELQRDLAVYFMTMDKARFRKPVRPGDQLIMKIKILRRRGPVFKMQGEAFVDGKLVAEAVIMATVDASAAEAGD